MEKHEKPQTRKSPVFMVKLMDIWDYMNKIDLLLQLPEIDKYKLIIDLKLNFLTVSSKSGLTQLLKKKLFCLLIITKR